MKSNILRWAIAAGLVVLALTIWISPAAADGGATHPVPNCMSCHENLYYNYDTGKHYCVSEAAERCTNCHGGDPQAVTMEAAHQDRSAHPIINDNTTKCAECHVDDCAAHVETFHQLAGMNEVVYIAAPLTPSSEIQALSQSPVEPTGTPFYVFYLGGVVLLIIVFGAGTLVYRAKSNKKQL